MKIFGPLYDRVMRWSSHPHAERYLGALSFAESSFFPIPPDVMLAPMCMAAPSRAWRYAFVTTLFSVLGGLAGYLIGYLAYEAIEPWLRESHYYDAYLAARAWFDQYGVWVVFVAGFSPIPYKIFTIAAGVAVLNLPGFFIASLVGRGARFFLVAGVVRYAGPKVEAALLRYIERIGWIVVLLTVLGIGYLTLR
jgi:membrane protein YqaA with SNARE-associated domain